MNLEPLIQIFGSAGVTFYIMWLWLKDVQKDKLNVIEKLKDEQDNRIRELREILPLLSEASKGLQDVIKMNESKNNEVIVEIVTHIDKKINEISEKCALINQK
jgi:hypothetical protein